MKFRKIVLPVFALMPLLLLLLAPTARAWETEGLIPKTEVGFSDLRTTKGGVNVRLTNLSHTPVKISAKLTFFDERSNVIGYTLFGLREIAGGSYADIAGNFLNGNWRKCRDAYRAEWTPMTYELVY